jgi:phytoene dehydrogenase-like protein
MKNTVSGKNVIVVGAGIGGLSAGILLSLGNYNVTVLEKNPVPGGLMRSYRRGGIDCPVGVHYVGALGEREPLGILFRAMGISVDDLFSPMGEDGVIDRYLFDDFVFDLPASLNDYENNLKNAFPGDGSCIDRIIANLREVSERFADFSFLTGGDPFQNLDFYISLGEMLEQMGASATLRSVLAVPCNLIGVPPGDCPVIFHHMILAGYLFSSWKLKEGGRAMTEAFVRRLQETGGRLLLNCDVREISVAQSKVTGVVLSSGERLSADVIIFATHPKLLLSLLAENALRESYRRRLRNLQETQSVLGVQVTLDAKRHPLMHHNIYRIETDEKGDIQKGVFYQLHQTRDPGSHLLSIITKSLYEDWESWSDTRTGCRGGAYEDRKTRLARQMLEEARPVFGDLDDARILDVYTPLTLRDYVNAPEGSCYGIMRSSRQLLRTITLNHVPVGGLFLAGQNALAPGVMGCMLGSFNVARQILGADQFAEIIGR